MATRFTPKTTTIQASGHEELRYKKDDEGDYYVAEKNSRYDFRAKLSIKQQLEEDLVSENSALVHVVMKTFFS